MHEIDEVKLVSIEKDQKFKSLNKSHTISRKIKVGTKFCLKRKKAAEEIDRILLMTRDGHQMTFVHTMLRSNYFLR